MPTHAVVVHTTTHYAHQPEFRARCAPRTQVQEWVGGSRLTLGTWVQVRVGGSLFELFEPTGLPLQQAGFVARADRHDQRAMPRPSQI